MLLLMTHNKGVKATEISQFTSNVITQEFLFAVVKE
jgi:hypothetical protein